MYCPECGVQYEEGIAVCADCGVALVAQPPTNLEPKYQETVKVFESVDKNEIALAESILQAAGIPFAVQNAASQGLFGGMARESMFAYIEVPPSHGEAAIDLLDALNEGIDESALEEYDDEDDEEDDEEDELKP